MGEKKKYVVSIFRPTPQLNIRVKDESDVNW